MTARRADAWDGALERLAVEAALQRDMSITAATSHIQAMREVIRARVVEHGGDPAVELAQAVVVLKAEINAALDRLLGQPGG